MENYNLKRKLSWFMSTDRCHYSGLAITHPETLVCSDPESNFNADIAKLGNNVLLLKSYGYSTSLTGSELVAFIDDFISKHFKSESGIVYIEYYSAIPGAAAESRKKYITYFKNNDFLIGMILYRLPPIFKISFNLAKKLHIYAARCLPVNLCDIFNQFIRILVGQLLFCFLGKKNITPF